MPGPKLDWRVYQKSVRYFLPMGLLEGETALVTGAAGGIALHNWIDPAEDA